ncbi:RluA family pseudouridine synthase [Endozoicomonas sp. SM1973]|uniref:Dual-specificity RNA pseudouridine synthase RluA n=1 Tax=Spartinivicinus marinus TaxID=2994442 RepID=A0A853IA88_9GAMM|nr:RluA family pseudouridine synthase [Spartinivicinus marinus]MCX4028755.1 RluA family pseudouridine synthase [Spartinivicinus marinus]NYZ67568.1 RluA family pseudouridine synthase [Spartinivicinus marinus]
MQYLNCIYYDDDLAVFDKPAKLLSVPSNRPELNDSLAARVARVFPTARIVHRLDWQTSGLIVMAMHLDSLRHLSKQFETRVVDKTYQAVVAGKLPQPQGRITLPLCVDWPNRPKQRIDYRMGRNADTRWKVLEYDGQKSRVELKPVTGRSHQLRLHLKALGTPILGDEWYAPASIHAQSSRMLLHAHILKLYHPKTNAPLEFASPIPF